MLICGERKGEYVPRAPDMRFHVGADGRLRMPIPERLASAIERDHKRSAKARSPKNFATRTATCGLCGKPFQSRRSRGKWTIGCCKSHGIKLHYQAREAAPSVAAAEVAA